MLKLQIRTDTVEIDGYVNAVGRDSRTMRDEATGLKFVEQIAPGTFAKAIQMNKEILLLLNHDKNRVLGSTEQGLKLFEDNIGLRAICTISDKEVVEKARKKELQGWSFGFRILDFREESTASGVKRRIINDMELMEVSLIDKNAIPCYAGTQINVRSQGQDGVIRSAINQEIPEYSYDFNNYKERILRLEKTYGF